MYHRWVDDAPSKLDCNTCLTEKKIILRNHLAKANHYARIYAGFIIRRNFPPENIKHPQILRDMHTIRPVESRSKVLSRLTQNSVKPLPTEYYKACTHGENEGVKFTQYL
jgi:hypothetical protein